MSIDVLGLIRCGSSTCQMFDYLPRDRHDSSPHRALGEMMILRMDIVRDANRIVSLGVNILLQFLSVS